MTVRLAEKYFDIDVLVNSHSMAREGVLIRRADCLRYAAFFTKIAEDGLTAPDLMVRGDLYGNGDRQMHPNDLAA